jgi:hypothetical protein
MSSVARALAITLGLAAIITAAMMVVKPRSEQYVQSTQYCQRCHTDEVSHVGEHGDVACQACHQMPKGQTLALLRGAFAGDSAMPPHGTLDKASCKACHSKDKIKWNALARTSGHATHALDPVLVACVTCHSSSLHERPKPTERCEACHAKTITKDKAGVQLDCLRCHVFGSGNALAHPMSLKADAPAWGKEITGKNVHGAADCRLCHNPHREEGSADKAQTLDCTSCHRSELARSVTHAPDNHKVCTTCHRPHGLRAELATACAVCHQKPRVRGEDRDPGVPPEMRGLTTIAPFLAARKGPPTPPPDITHEGVCAKCHEPHSWQPNKTICRTCHEKKAATVEALPPDTHSCLGCHEPHSPKPGKEACARCHADKIKSVMAAAPAKHHDCLSCHEPHHGKPIAAQMCGTNCHHDQMAALREGQEKHRDCGNCHSPHTNPKLEVFQRCKQCHEKPLRDFGTTNKHERCSRCHDQHEFNKKAARARCAKCHKDKVAGPTVAHDGTCIDCHNNHLPGRGLATQCRTCHSDIQPQVPTHQQCNSCHKPHTKSVVASTQCANCHAKQREVQPTWPAKSPHAPGRCAECHNKHDESNKVLCQSCHKDKPGTKHMGVHKECKGCHAPHLPYPSDALGWWGRCGNCHKQESAAAATGNPKHQLCANCHNNPGREPKLCATCHAPMKQQGEHQQPKHDKCTNCHSTHGTAAPTRKVCEVCHKDRRAHFPDAPKCQACHPFTKE